MNQNLKNEPEVQIVLANKLRKVQLGLALLNESNNNLLESCRKVEVGSTSVARKLLETCSHNPYEAYHVLRFLYTL